MPDPASQWWQIANAAGLAALPRLRRGFNTVVTNLPVSGNDLRRALDRNRFAAAADAFDWKSFEGDLSETMLAESLPAARRAARQSAKLIGVTPDLEIVERRLRERVRKTARQMAKESRAAVKLAARRLTREVGLSSIEAAGRLKQIAGMNSQGASGFVTRYAAELRDGMTPRAKDKMARKLERAHKASRASMTALANGSAAAELGQQAQIDKALADGEIESVKQKWVSRMAGNTCVRCRRLHNQVRNLGERFVDPGTGISYDGPPDVHPRCQCHRDYQFKKTERRAA